MGVTVYPSANDVQATGAGDGANLLEQSFVQLLGTLIGQNFVVSGFTLPATDADLTIPVALGVAVLDGHYVNVDAPVNVVCADDDLNYIFLKLTKDGGGNVSDAVFEANVTGTPPTDSVLIGTATAASGAITATTDNRNFSNTFPHGHTATTDGGILGASSVIGNAMKTVAKSYTTGSFNSSSATSHIFSTGTTGRRIGEFTIQLNNGNIGEAGISQFRSATGSGGGGTAANEFRLSVAAHPSGSGGKTITVRWDEQAPA